MATVSFLYRSTKPTAFLNLRLLFRHNNTDFVFGAKTKVLVSNEYWNKHHKSSEPQQYRCRRNPTSRRGGMFFVHHYLPLSSGFPKCQYDKLF